MPDDDKKPQATGPKITGLDISKNVVGALLIAFFVYWLPVLADQIYSPTEVRYHHIKLGNLSGYLFSIQNFSRNPIDELSIFIDAQIGEALQDGAVSIEIAASSHPSMVKLKSIAPRTDATLFVALATTLDPTQVRVSSSSTITTFEDTKLIQKSFWSLSTFFTSTFTALLYLTLGLYVAVQRRQMEVRAEALQSDMQRLSDNSKRLQETTDKRVEEITQRLMRARVHMVRQITRLNEEIAVWRRFFRSLYSSTYGSKSDAEPAMELILKLSGVHMTKRLRDYSEREFLDILEQADLNHSKDTEKRDTSP
jgi:hypothetical protein